jgi:diguanylate cyclase (GGDEF)-like protein
VHKLLKEQIKRYLGSLDNASKEVQALLAHVDEAYQEADLIRVRLEKSRDNISEELIKRQHLLQREIEEGRETEKVLQRYAKRLETLHEIDRAILKAGSPQDIACAAVERMRAVLDIKTASVSLADFETGEMIEVCISREEGLDKSSMNRYSLDESLHHRLREGNIHSIEDLSKEKSPLVHVNKLQDEGVRSHISVPLIARDHLVGILELGVDTPGAFEEEKIEIAREVADQVAVSVQQAALLNEVQRLNENLELRIIERTAELERRAHEISLLNEMGEMLHSCVNSEEAYKAVAQIIPRIFPYLEGALGVLKDAGQLLEFRTSWGVEIPEEANFLRDDCWALRRGQAHLVEEIRPGLLCKHVEADEGYQPWFITFCIPLLAQSEMIGVLYMRSKKTESDSTDELEIEFTDANRQLALTVAEQIALALANLKLRETLRVQAIRDPLTGLYNRRYMEESLARELKRSTRNGSELGVVMLDIDHFKDFNDKYGHAVGDAMLRELGNFLQERVRQEDIACKYGGEEFVLILPNAGLEITRERAERIRADIKEVRIEVEGMVFENITISLGVSVFPKHGAQWENILRAADVALYQAKANGRDQVVVGKHYKQPENKATKA